MAKKFGTHTPRSARTKQAASLCRGRGGVRGKGERRGTMADNKRRRRHKMAAECGAARKDAARFLAPLQLKFAVSLWLMASAHTQTKHTHIQSTHTQCNTHALSLTLWRVSVGKWQTTPKRKCLAGISRRRRQATAGADNVICFRLRALCTCLVSLLYPLAIRAEGYYSIVPNEYVLNRQMEAWQMAQRKLKESKNIFEF